MYNTLFVVTLDPSNQNPVPRVSNSQNLRMDHWVFVPFTQSFTFTLPGSSLSGASFLNQQNYVVGKLPFTSHFTFKTVINLVRQVLKVSHKSKARDRGQFLLLLLHLFLFLILLHCKTGLCPGNLGRGRPGQDQDQHHSPYCT